MNASCTRSKNSLKEVVGESVSNTSIENFYKGDFSSLRPFILAKYLMRLGGFSALQNSANVVVCKKFLFLIWKI